MATLKLQPAPTFWAKVPIPLPGGEKHEIELEFVHKTRDDLDKWRSEKDVKTDGKAVMTIVKNWRGVEGDFNEDNINAVLQNYHGAGIAIGRTYIEQLMQLKLGN